MTDPGTTYVRSLQVLQELSKLTAQQRELDLKLKSLVAEAFSCGVTASVVAEVTGLRKTRIYRLRDLGKQA